MAAPRPLRRRIDIGYALPGLISWTVAIVGVVCMVVAPHTWLYVAIVFMAYFVARMAFTLGFSLVGQWRLGRWATRDWRGSADELGPFGFAPADVHHVVVVPSYQEPLPILRRTLDGLARQQRADERVIVVLGMEEREAASRQKGELLAAEYASRFRHVEVTVHPTGLPDEVAGKSSNEAWAARSIPDVVAASGIDPARVTITSCDADSVLHDEYLAAVSQHFAHDEQRHARFWQAPLFFYNNIWSVPMGVRLSTWFTHAIQLSELSAPGFQALPISTYTLSMPLAIESDWWDPAVIPEDWHTFLNAQFTRRGDVTLTPIFLATHGDATDGETWSEAMRSRNLQLMRHAWGAEDVGWIVEQLAYDKETRRGFGFFRFAQVLHDHLIRSCSWFMLMSAWVLSSIMGQVRVPGLHFTPYSNELTLISWGFTAGGVLMMSQLVLDIVRNPPPRAMPWWRVIVELGLMWVTLPLTGWYFGAGPALAAQTRLMFNLPIGYRVTPKRIASLPGTSRLL